MGFAIEMYLDADTEGRIRRLWSKLAEKGVSDLLPSIGSRPHVSLAVLDRLNPVQMRGPLEAFARREPPVSIEFAAIGSFPTEEGVLFLAPVVTAPLLSLHYRFHRVLEELGVRSLDYYRPGRWVPHCTVAAHLAPGALPIALDLCCDSPVFGPASFTAVGLVEFRPVREICTLHLAGSAR